MPEVSHFQRRKDQFENIHFLSIQYKHWKRLHQYVVLRNLLPITEKALLHVFELAEKKLEKIQLLNELVAIMGITPKDPEKEIELERQLIEQFKAKQGHYPISAFYLAYLSGWNIDDIFDLLKYEGLQTDSDSLSILLNEKVAARFIPRIRMSKSLGTSAAQLIGLGEIIAETKNSGQSNGFSKL